MIRSTRIYIPIPKVRNTKCKVEVNGVDVTGRVVDSIWVKPVTRGLGTFNITLSNAKGQYSGDYSVGDAVKFYADNTDNTILQFWGRIDYVKDDLDSRGQFLNIEGRHRAFLLNEYFVCHSATGTVTSQILKDIIDKIPGTSGITYTNVQTDTTEMNVEWNYKPFWDCVAELTNKAGYDCYVDNDLDFHYFAENSIANSGDSIVEGDNFIKSRDTGTNNYYEKTRVIAMGRDSSGLPIVYTAISSSEGDEVREVFISDASADTYEKVQDIAEAKLIEVTNKNLQQKILSYGLETVQPGDNIWIIVPRQKIAGQYKLVQITHKFGMKSGGWRTESITEELEAGMAETIQNLNKTSQQIKESKNIFKLNFSYNFDFDTDVGDHTTTEITRGVLKTSGGSATGTWVSPIRTLDSNVSFIELRTVGEQLTSSIIYISLDGGTTWYQISNLREETVIPTTGKKLRVKVEFYAAVAQLDSLAILYS